MDTVLGSFEWDTTKNEGNKAKHKIAFEDAVEVFERPTLKVRSDRHSETRWAVLGEAAGRVIVVICTARNDRIRVISARMARTREREIYRQRFPDTS